jgi:hypothetical protein
MVGVAPTIFLYPKAGLKAVHFETRKYILKKIFEPFRVTNHE